MARDKDALVGKHIDDFDASDPVGALMCAWPLTAQMRRILTKLAMYHNRRVRGVVLTGIADGALSSVRVSIFSTQGRFDGALVDLIAQRRL